MLRRVMNLHPLWLVALPLWVGAGEPVVQGLATRYPGDVNIAQDPAVLFAESFAEDSIAALVENWTEAKGARDGTLSFAADVPPGSPGRQSLQIAAVKGQNTGGHLWKLFKPGVDELYARFYVKFSQDHPYVHHFVKIGAWRDSPNWPQGEAGHRHDGAKSFQTGLEPMSAHGRFDPPGAWHFYTYWCEMRSWQGPAGTSCYGNAFAPAAPQPVPRDRWQCVEFMVKANSAPDRHDGEQAFWIDGQLAGRWAPGTPRGHWVKDRFLARDDGEPFEGFRWRTDDAVKLNTFWLLYYLEGVFQGDAQFKPRPGVTQNPAASTVRFAHVVVARQYLGPLAPAAR